MSRTAKAFKPGCRSALMATLASAVLAWWSAIAAAQTTFPRQVYAAPPTYSAETTSIQPQKDTDPPLVGPAPMPNADIYAPIPRVEDPKAAQVRPNLFRPREQFRGDGYSPGSTVQASQERQLKPAPGISMKVPLD